MRGVPVQLQMTEQWPAGTQHGGILRGRDPSKIAGTDVAGTLTEHLGLVVQSVTFHERIVHDEVATSGVLDKEGDVRCLIKKLFQQRRIHRGHGSRQRRDDKLGCASFHIGTQF